MLDMQYFRREGLYLNHSWDVYRDYFKSRGNFLGEYNKLPTNERKNLFLMIVSSYRRLVRDGQYHLRVNGRYLNLEYVDTTYKFITLMSLIEALFAADEFVDFYQWLTMKERRDKIFPIVDPQMLEDLYRTYKDEFGAKKALRFFSELDEDAQTFLAARIKVDNNSHTPTEMVAKKLYVMRSEFVHQARLVLEFNGGAMFSRRAGSVMYSTLSFQDLQLLFEHGILHHFGMTPDQRKI